MADKSNPSGMMMPYGTAIGVALNRTDASTDERSRCAIPPTPSSAPRATWSRR
jgi:hypothetical protein